MSQVHEFNGGPAMKIETLLLSLLVRFLEVGVKERLPALPSPTVDPPVFSIPQVVCDCHCVCLNNSGLGSRDFLVGLVGASLPIILYFLSQCCRQKEVPNLEHASPRRKGGGVIVMPARR